MIAAAVALYVLGEAIRIAVVVADPSWAARSLRWIPHYLEFFAIGMAAAVFAVVTPSDDDIARPLRWLALHPAV
jgi:hypothetical protein